MTVKPNVVVFSGPTATISNSPPLVTSNKARTADEKVDGRYEHLVPQRLHAPVTVQIRKFTAHPLEEDSREIFADDGRDYVEVTLTPEDGLYPLPYMARRAGADGADHPFDGKPADGVERQTFFPDASRIFEEIDRTVSGRTQDGRGFALGELADYEFVRVLPPGGYLRSGEQAGRDFFPYSPPGLAHTPGRGHLARVANTVQEHLSTGKYDGAVWLEGSPTLEETLYWLSLLCTSSTTIAGCASQRTHGELSNDGDRNLVDAVRTAVHAKDVGVVGVLDEQIYAARALMKTDDRPGNYVASGGHGGVLGSVGPPTQIWYLPGYRHTASSQVNLTSLPEVLEYRAHCGASDLRRLPVLDDGRLLPEAVPDVAIFKYGAYSEVEGGASGLMEKALEAAILHAGEAASATPVGTLHGLVFEGVSPYGVGSDSVRRLLELASLSGVPVVRVGRGTPGGTASPGRWPLTIAGSNLDSTKARLLLMAALMKLGPLPIADNPRDPSSRDRHVIAEKVQMYQELFDTH